ncbi:integrase catalytic region [Ferroglobus placidus DSM 10642]|uniref:Integrase catalytic region n=1 Tax=Ferroglobus placidus (strain DSM 10642 / AEDII12DO) TaxID=589924 RepID=D3S1G0_FERPA|nr:hypothetical protein [Ferroglobus placidus]ADC66424.1 integrase catalytic region [Ferroglobus placidus DSM 10642]
MYFELTVDPVKREEIKDKLLEICEEVYEVSPNYDFLVRVDSEEKLKNIEGIKKIRRHYNC